MLHLKNILCSTVGLRLGSFCNLYDKCVHLPHKLTIQRLDKLNDGCSRYYYYYKVRVHISQYTNISVMCVAKY